MAIAVISAGDVGTVFSMTVLDETGTPLDLRTSTAVAILFKRPTGAFSRTASFLTDGSDGKLVYTIVAGDLDVGGAWQCQAYVTFTASAWHGTINDFTVTWPLL